MPEQTADAPAFPFLRRADRPPKPRTVGRTEIRGPYYTAMGAEHLADLLDGVAQYVDSFKIGSPIAVMPRRVLSRYIDACHERDVRVSTGGFIEYVLTQGRDAAERFFAECADIGFDIVEISAGMITLPLDDFLRLIERAKQNGLSVTAEVGIQFGAGGSSSVEDLASEGTGDPRWAVHRARRALEVGADLVMVESEGITEQVREWRTDVAALFASELGLEQVMFEAADPAVFRWYIKNYGPDVNLFVDYSQIYQLECLRAGIWGDASLFGRVHTFRD